MWTAYQPIVHWSQKRTQQQPFVVYLSFLEVQQNEIICSALWKKFKKCDILSPGTKTIVTLDLQLYSNSEIYNFVLRLGELHVVFTAFKMLGKIIDSSGLGKAFEEALIYGNNIVEQIKDGYHLYRLFEDHQILYFSLFKQ